MFSCFHCKQELFEVDRYIKISLVYETKYPGEGKIFFHIECFSKMAGKRFIDILHKELREGQSHHFESFKDPRKDILETIEQLRQDELKKRENEWAQMKIKEMSSPAGMFPRHYIK